MLSLVLAYAAQALLITDVARWVDDMLRVFGACFNEPSDFDCIAPGAGGAVGGGSGGGDALSVVAPIMDTFAEFRTQVCIDLGCRCRRAVSLFMLRYLSMLPDS